MTSEPASPERLSEVLRLCTTLADRALDALITAGSAPADQTIALAKAARLLQDHGVEWPPLLTQVLHELADKKGQPEPEAKLSDGIDVQGLTGFLADLWKEKKR